MQHAQRSGRRAEGREAALYLLGHPMPALSTIARAALAQGDLATADSTYHAPAINPTRTFPTFIGGLSYPRKRPQRLDRPRLPQHQRAEGGEGFFQSTSLGKSIPHPAVHQHDMPRRLDHRGIRFGLAHATLHVASVNPKAINASNASPLTISRVLRSPFRNSITQSVPRRPSVTLRWSGSSMQRPRSGAASASAWWGSWGRWVIAAPRCCCPRLRASGEDHGLSISASDGNGGSVVRAPLTMLTHIAALRSL